MDYLVDKYLKKPDYIKELFEKPVTISLKIDGSAFQIFYNKEEDKIEYHKRGGSSSKLGPIIDEYTQLFTKHLNDAIDFFDNKKEILKQNKFYAIEIFDDMYVLLNVIDNHDKVLSNVEAIAKELDIESLPILLDNKTLSKESQEDLISMCTLKEDTSNENFILLIKKIFGSGDYEKFLKGDEIEGIVLTWVIDDKPVQYKIINPAFKTRHEAEQKSKAKEAEKDTIQLNKLIESLYSRLEDVAKYRDDNWIKNLDLNFFEMCSDPNWLSDVKNIAKEITPNTNKWFMLQMNKVSDIVKKLLNHNGEELKTIYEKYLMTFNKPKKRAFIISKEFQTNINHIIEKLQSKNESLQLYTKMHMKTLNNYITESNYRSSNLEDLKKQLLKMNNGDRINFLWAVTEKATDATGKDRMVEYVMSIDKGGKHYTFCSSFLFKGNEMIKEICKDLSIKKWARLLDIAIAVDYEDVVKILDAMPKYFDKYAGDKKFVHFITFDYKEAEEECARQKRPFEITSLEDEIKATERAIKDLEQKKEQLTKLKKAQAEEDMYKWANNEK